MELEDDDDHDELSEFNSSWTKIVLVKVISHSAFCCTMMTIIVIFFAIFFQVAVISQLSANT